MTEILLLRLDAPLMSFGSVSVDSLGRTEPMPTKSMLVGLLANALGFDHSEHDRLERMQTRLRYGALCEREGETLVDYQTVDLGQIFLGRGWTTRGRAEGRGGGSASSGTHIRHRHYLADALFLVAIAFDPADERPTLTDAEQALRRPERPLFLGRKPCIPSSELVVRRTEAASLWEALVREPHPTRSDSRFRVWLPSDERAGSGRLLTLTDERDWANRAHVGRRNVGETWHAEPAAEMEDT